jgi:hypothetical protein
MATVVGKGLILPYYGEGDIVIFLEPPDDLFGSLCIHRPVLRKHGLKYFLQTNDPIWVPSGKVSLLKD